jgi:D-arabinose 1-dehydrogenase-like Zn-dependent alcohol dehydrogenase
VALAALDRGGTRALAGIEVTPISAMDYQQYLFLVRDLRTVTANTREDGRSLLELAASVRLHTTTQEFPLAQTNEALQMTKHDHIKRRYRATGLLKGIDLPEGEETSGIYSGVRSGDDKFQSSSL